MTDLELIAELYRIQVIKLGSFTLKSGSNSPIYFDLRAVVSYPRLMRRVAELLWDKVKDIPTDLICGVPYTALPLATCISINHDIPMVMRRKEVKAYGTKKKIEGVFQAGQSVLVVEDIITSGASIMETVKDLSDEGLRISHNVVFLDREQGGRANIESQGFSVTSVFTMHKFLDLLNQSVDLPAEEKRALDEALSALKN